MPDIVPSKPMHELEVSIRELGKIHERFDKKKGLPPAIDYISIVIRMMNDTRGFYVRHYGPKVIGKVPEDLKKIALGFAMDNIKTTLETQDMFIEIAKESVEDKNNEPYLKEVGITPEDFKKHVETLEKYFKEQRPELEKHIQNMVITDLLKAQLKHKEK